MVCVVSCSSPSWYVFATVTKISVLCFLALRHWSHAHSHMSKSSKILRQGLDTPQGTIHSHTRVCPLHNQVTFAHVLLPRNPRHTIPNEQLQTRRGGGQHCNHLESNDKKVEHPSLTVKGGGWGDTVKVSIDQTDKILILLRLDTNNELKNTHYLKINSPRQLSDRLDRRRGQRDM